MSHADFLFHIITASGVPIYRQLMDQIHTLIAAGRLRPGMFLPSIREVGKELEINPMTVSKAYSLLERDGVLKNVRGQGMQVVGGVKSREDLKARKQAMIPLLEQVMLNARQLALGKQETLKMLEALWKERSK